MMQRSTDQNGPNVETLTTVIARSQIVVPMPVVPTNRLPAGFDEMDMAVLDWIVREGRRLGRRLVQM